jgi:2-methylcitrate dehydratase PrpD
MLTAAAKPLPPAVEVAASRTLFNVIGTATSAAGTPAVTILLAAAAEAGSAGDVPVPGVARTLDPYWGALVTGTAAHLDDFDDTHLATVIHPGAATLATVLSLAPETDPPGAAFLAAFAVGCEAQLRIGNAISPAHYDHGWHITGTCGVFGAAVAASVLLGLDAEAAGRALSLAATMTLGHREAFGSMTKPLHAGKAAANGVLAARLAVSGLAGSPDPLGAGGVLEVLADRVDRTALVLGHGSWELESNTFKTYPCGVVAHPAMDAAIAASDRVDPAEVTAITLRCHPLVPELMGTVQPEDGLRSRFSARHGVAAGLLFGRAGLAEFTDEVATAPEVARLRGLITLDPDPGVARDAAVLRIETRSAGPVEVVVEHTRGSAARPLTDADLLDKVRGLTDPVLGEGAADRIRLAVAGLPAAADVSSLVAALRPTSEAPGLGVFTASHRRQQVAPNDAASHPRRPTPSPAPGNTTDTPGAGSAVEPAAVSTTERILALAARPAPTREGDRALVRFTAAVTTEAGVAAARGLLRALRPDAGVGSTPTSAGGTDVPGSVPAAAGSPDVAGSSADAAGGTDVPGSVSAVAGSPDLVGSSAASAGSSDDAAPPRAAAGRLAVAGLPDGAALTAWVTGTAAVAAPEPTVPSAAGASHALAATAAGPVPGVALVVCAAAKALGEDCAAAVAAGLEAAALVEGGLEGVGGWSVPDVSAAIGAGVAAGVMLGLPADRLRNALGICATQAAGLRAAAGTEAGPMQAGKAAFNAVEAALLARAGFTGPAEPLDGRRGLFALFRG